MLRLAKPRFRVAEFGDCQPFIFIEQVDGDEIDLFSDKTDLRLKDGTSYDDAVKVADFLNEHISQIAQDY